MRELADDVWQGWPPNNVNVHVLGDGLIDAGLATHRARRLAELGPSLVCCGHGKPLHDTARFTALAR